MKLPARGPLPTEALKQQFHKNDKFGRNISGLMRASQRLL
jgi:hypothetical protein